MYIEGASDEIISSRADRNEIESTNGSCFNCMTNVFTNRQRYQILHQLANCYKMDISQYAEMRGMWDKSAFQVSTFTDDQKLEKETDCINCVKLVKKVCLKEKSGERCDQIPEIDIEARKKATTWREKTAYFLSSNRDKLKECDMCRRKVVSCKTTTNFVDKVIQLLNFGHTNDIILGVNNL